VRIVGHVPYEEMARYYQAADVCVSIPSSDSSPRSVWEAMACGAPCVLSDIPWVRELIEDERHALVVPIDEDAVAEALRELLDNPALAGRIRVDARRLVEEHRDRDRETERLCAIYDQVALEGGRRSRLPRALGAAAGAAGTAEAIVRRALARGADQRQAGDS
jgi:glycosyltransferase involved in cell wall biosynthesis